MPNIDLALNNIQDQIVRDNFKKLQDFINGQGVTQNQFQACEIYVTDNVTGLKIGHKLGSMPLDFILTRLIAPSAARLTASFADFTKDNVVVNVTGLAAGETLSARFLVGSFPDVVTVGTVVRASSETQQMRSKF